MNVRHVASNEFFRAAFVAMTLVSVGFMLRQALGISDYVGFRQQFTIAEALLYVFHWLALPVTFAYAFLIGLVVLALKLDWRIGPVIFAASITLGAVVLYIFDGYAVALPCSREDCYTNRVPGAFLSLATILVSGTVLIGLSKLVTLIRRSDL